MIGLSIQQIKSIVKFKIPGVCRINHGFFDGKFEPRVAISPDFGLLTHQSPIWEKFAITKLLVRIVTSLVFPGWKFAAFTLENPL